MKISLGWLYWIAYQLLAAVLGVAGLVVLIPFAMFQWWEVRPSRNPQFEGRAITAWRWGWLTMLWGNDEDGVSQDGSRWGAYQWCALRNPVNNLRLIRGASFLVDNTCRKTIYPWGYVATQGWRQCVFYRGIRFGWLIGEGIGSRAWPVLEKV